MKKYIFLISMFFIIGCSNDGHDKSIMEPLTDEELKANIEKVPEFEETYQAIGLIRKMLQTDQVLTVKYQEITYGDVLDFDKIELDKEAVDAEHAKKYPNRKELRDKANAKLMHYLSIQPDSLISIRFVAKKMRKSYYSSRPELSFEITPLKGTVKRVSFSYAFAPKSENCKSYSDAPYGDLNNSIYDYETFSSKRIFKDELFTTSEKYKSLTTEDLKRDYDVFYKISDITYNGEEWSDVPYCIRNVIEDWDENQSKWANDRFEKDAALDLIIIEYFSDSYESFNSYYNTKFEEIQKERYPLLYELTSSLEDIASLSLLQGLSDIFE